jgi:hypothetical protein
MLRLLQLLVLLPPETSVSFKSITKEKIKNLSTILNVPRDQLIGSPHQDHPTLEIHLILKLKLITGSMRIELGMKRIETMKLEELNCIWLKDLFFLHMFSVLKQSPLLFTTK